MPSVSESSLHLVSGYQIQPVAFFLLLLCVVSCAGHAQSHSDDGDGMILIGADGLEYTGSNFTVGDVNLLQKLQDLESRLQSLTGMLETCNSRSEQLETTINQTLAQMQSTIGLIQTRQDVINASVQAVTNQSLSIQYKIITTNSTYRMPTNVQYITVEMVGAGGGGGGATGIVGAQIWVTASSGGMGGYVFKMFNRPDLVRFKTMEFVIGNGGKGGRNGVQYGGIGGNTSFVLDGKAVVTATGGDGGCSSASIAMSNCTGSMPPSGTGIGGDFNTGVFTHALPLVASFPPNPSNSTGCTTHSISGVYWYNYGTYGLPGVALPGFTSSNCWGRDGHPGAVLVTEYFLF